MYLGQTIDTLRTTLGTNEPRTEAVKAGPMRVTRTEGDLQQLVNEVKGQVKKIGITGKQQTAILYT